MNQQSQQGQVALPPGTQVLSIALLPTGEVIVGGQVNTPRDAHWMLHLAAAKVLRDGEKLQQGAGGLVPPPPGLVVPRT